MSGNRVAWHERRNGVWDIYVYDFATGSETRVTSNDADQAGPSIYGDTIAWWDLRHGGPWGDLYTYDLRTGVERRITEGSTLARGPIVTADRIVWGDTRGGYFTPYAYELRDGLENPVAATSLVSCTMAASPSGRYAAWADRDESNHVDCDDLWLYDFLTGSLLRLTNDAAVQWFPALTDEFVAWEDHRDGRTRVYVARLSSLPW